MSKRIAFPKVALLCAGVAAAAMVSIAPANAQYRFKLLHSFCKFTNCGDGNLPQGALLVDQTGEIFGGTELGGKYNGGDVFKLALNGTRYREYLLENALDSVGDLVMDRAGVLYGVAGSCDASNLGGAIFSLTHTDHGWHLQVLHDFDYRYEEICYGLAFKGMESGALWDGSSPLFGVTDSGGRFNNGYVYELMPAGWTYTDIHDFQTSSFPDRPLVDSAGNVFGTVEGGGKYGGGIMYKLAAGTWNESILKNFCSQTNCTDGWVPVGKPVIDAAGDVFTATRVGGLAGCIYQSGCGTIFERTAGGGNRTLYSFCALADCADGANPDAGLTLDSAGHLFGTTRYGGVALHCGLTGGCGTAIELTQNTDGSWSEAVLHPFCNWNNCDDGGYSQAPLALDNAGNLFGTAADFGAYGNAQAGGTVFELVAQ